MLLTSCLFLPPPAGVGSELPPLETHITALALTVLCTVLSTRPNMLRKFSKPAEKKNEKCNFHPLYEEILIK